VIARAARTITATVEPSDETTGIWLSARTPKEEAVAMADMRIDGGGSSPAPWLSAEKMA
jgi:hypothetical protein